MGWVVSHYRTRWGWESMESVVPGEERPLGDEMKGLKHCEGKQVRCHT